RRQRIGRPKPVKGHVPIDAERSGQRLHRSVQRVVADDIEVDVEAAPDDARERPQQHRIILDGVQAGDAQQPPRRTAGSRVARRGWKAGCLDPHWNDVDACAGERRHPRHETGRHGDARGVANRAGRCATVDPAALQAVPDVVEGYQLAGVEGDQNRDAESAADLGRNDAAGHDEADAHAASASHERCRRDVPIRARVSPSNHEPSRRLVLRQAQDERSGEAMTKRARKTENRWTVLVAALLVLAPDPARPLMVARDTLDIYFIDVEGGQSTLLVTPAGDSLLVDTGYPGFDGRDPTRILAAARDAGVTRIDYLLITHFHTDHDGGV